MPMIEVPPGWSISAVTRANRLGITYLDGVSNASDTLPCQFYIDPSDQREWTLKRWMPLEPPVRLAAQEKLE